jgi:ABC-type glutathione transport system ATPase component
MRPEGGTDPLDSLHDCRRNRLNVDFRSDRRVAVLISHRSSTARMADRILVLESGRMIEHGSHGELVALGAGMRSYSSCRLRDIDDVGRARLQQPPAIISISAASQLPIRFSFRPHDWLRLP